MALALALGWLVPAQGQDGHWLTGYYAIYDQNGVMTPSQVDMTKLTHIIYWGVEPTDTGPSMSRPPRLPAGPPTWWRQPTRLGQRR